MLHGSFMDEKKLVEEDYDALDALVKPYKFGIVYHFSKKLFCCPIYEYVF